MNIEMNPTSSKLTPTALKDKKEQAKRTLRYQRDKDRETVKGIFRFFELPGGAMSFVIKIYKEDPVERYDFMDGQVYSIPLGVAKHLNKNGWYPEYTYVAGEAGTQSAFNGMTGGGMRIGKKVRRFGFQSLEFVDIEDLQPAVPLITVEAMGPEL